MMNTKVQRCTAYSDMNIVLNPLKVTLNIETLNPAELTGPFALIVKTGFHYICAN